MKLGNIAVILVTPENPDNIGAVARAIKNMGFSDLRLIRPPRKWRVQGKKLAMSAADTLKKAIEYPSLQEAVRDLGLVIGTTRRKGGGRGTFLSFDQVVTKIRKSTARQKVGIVFGCESKGLANQDSGLCDHLVTIPTGKAYPSLNLAQAVMVMLFSISWRRDAQKVIHYERALNKQQIDITIQHFERALRVLGYRQGGADLLPRILQTLRGLIKRNGLLEPEAQMIKGLSRRITEKVLSGEKAQGE